MFLLQEAYPTSDYNGVSHNRSSLLLKTPRKSIEKHKIHIFIRHQRAAKIPRTRGVKIPEGEKLTKVRPAFSVPRSGDLPIFGTEGKAENWTEGRG